MIRLTHCLLTGYKLPEPFEVNEMEGQYLTYPFAPIGKTIIALPTLLSFINSGQLKHPILAGLCRNAFEEDETPPIITQEFITKGIKDIKYPKSFKEKIRHLLKYIYTKGGNEFKYFEFNSAKDYPLCYSEDKEEFARIIEYLSDNDFIKIKKENIIAGGVKLYKDLQLTDNGINEVEKELPKVPLIGLVQQKIQTGDLDTDRIINHAKDLFFQEPQTLDKMRSACENLSYVLEPLRKNLEKYFSSSDISDFFKIVNTFDIRHNKDKTKNIEHPEQLEWVFYTLLNTINTYVKLTGRLEKK